MNESLWMYFFMMMGIFGIVIINVFGQVLLSNEQNYYLLKESTEAAMLDAIDLNAYRGDGEWEIGTEGNSCIPKTPGTIKIIREKFVESFARRFAGSANLDRQYRVIFNDIDECPPKVSISLIASERFSMLEIFNVTYDADTNIVNNLSGIIEANLKTIDDVEVTPTVDVCNGEKTATETYTEWGTCNYSTNTQSRYKITQYRVGSTLCGTTREIEQKNCFEQPTPTNTPRYCTKPYTEYTPVVTRGEFGACNPLTGIRQRQKVTEYIDGTVRCRRIVEYETDTCSIPEFVIPDEVDPCEHPEMFPQSCKDEAVGGWSSCNNSSMTQTWKRTCTARGEVCSEKTYQKQEWCYSPPASTPVPTQRPTKTPTPTKTSTPKPTATPKPKPKATPKPTATPSCFLEGTPVLTDDGYKDIDKIEVGDMVLSYNEEKGINEFSRVSETFIHEDQFEKLYTLTIDGKELKITATHQVYVKRYINGEETIDYVEARRLKEGDQVRFSDGTYHTIEKTINYYQKNTYYNIEVENNHNYYVSDQEILVHNKGPAGCFPAGTLVLTENGYEEINKIKVGDKVLTYNSIEDKNEYKTVEQTFEHETLNEYIYSITVDNFSFEVTETHGIYLKRQMMGFTYFSGYLPAMDLQVGDQIRYSDGTFHTIEDVSYDDQKTNVMVYNMAVEDNHNYYVTDKNILVHNRVEAGWY